VFVQIRSENARDILGHVLPNAALLFRQTAPMNNAAARGSGSGDTTNSCHDSKKDGQRPAEVRFVK
jgi:hypothetical protein